jgi:hypothetical protein
MIIAMDKRILHLWIHVPETLNGETSLTIPAENTERDIKVLMTKFDRVYLPYIPNLKKFVEEVDFECTVYNLHDQTAQVFVPIYCNKIFKRWQKIN